MEFVVEENLLTRRLQISNQRLSALQRNCRPHFVPSHGIANSLRHPASAISVWGVESKAEMITRVSHNGAPLMGVCGANLISAEWD
jgi:hypothetical protein